jgi:hypothetical protein
MRQKRRNARPLTRFRGLPEEMIHADEKESYLQMNAGDRRDILGKYGNATLHAGLATLDSWRSRLRQNPAFTSHLSASFIHEWGARHR